MLAGRARGEAARRAYPRSGSSLTTPPETAMSSAHLGAVVTPYTIPTPLMDVLQLTSWCWWPRAPPRWC